MLNESPNGNELAETRKYRMQTMRVGYQPEFSGKLNKALHYVIRKIGFRPIEDFILIKEMEHLKLVDANENILTLQLETLQPQSSTGSIIFYTDDCLRDYHKYLVAGVEFIKRPEYTPAGLQVQFIDDEDNCYTLLEERIYTDA